MPNVRSRSKRRLATWIDKDLHEDWMQAHKPGEATRHLAELLDQELRRMKRRRKGRDEDADDDPPERA
jgi:hypothetical protein